MRLAIQSTNEEDYIYNSFNFECISWLHLILTCTNRVLSVGSIKLLYRKPNPGRMVPNQY